MNPSNYLRLTEDMIIRPIQARDNKELAKLITSVWAEYDASDYFDESDATAQRDTGTAVSDPKLNNLDLIYQVPADQAFDRGYWVVFDETRERVLGGCGFAPLIGAKPSENICEMQKLYFHPDLRGRGFGRQLVTWVLEQATLAGYEEIYLETIPEMTSAVRLYERFGFQRSPERRGTTGHWRCQLFMSRPLTQPVVEAPKQRHLAIVR